MWLYVPSTFCPSAPASADSNSVSPWRFRALARSATWRGKLQPPRAWSRRWKQGGFIRLLSGVTLPPSTLDLGVASYISSLRETHARITQSPESEPEPMASGSLLPRSSGSPTSAGLILSSAKMSSGTLTDSSTPSSRLWKSWATALRQEYSARPRPETPCGASGCSSWPSASVMDTGDNTDLTKIQARREKHKARGINGNGFGMSLGEAARQWPAPATLDSTNTRNSTAVRRTYNPKVKIADTLCDAVTQWRAPSDISKRGGSQPAEKRQAGGHSVNLEDQAEHWAGPAAQNHKGSSEGSITRKDGKSRDDLLHYQAEQFFRPPSSPGRPIAGGSTSSTDGQNSNQPSVKRKLNPIFVEALMRWPTGLSGFERQAMAWTLWQQRMQPFVSALVSQKRAEPNLFDLMEQAA